VNQVTIKTVCVTVLTVLIIWSLALIPSRTIAEEIAIFELKVPPLKSEQPLLKSIRLWNSEIVAATEKYEPVSKRWVTQYYLVDLKKGFYPLVIEGCAAIAALAETTQQAFVLCRNGKHPRLLSRIKAKSVRWHLEAVPKDIRVDGDVLLAAFENNLALLSSAHLYWRTPSRSWLRMALHPPSSVQAKGTPQHALLTNHGLFVGYDHGEFGGGLIYLTTVKAKSSHPLGDPQFLSSMNVNAIVEDSAGAVWVSGGLAHLVMESSELIVIRNGAAKTVIKEKSFGEKIERSGLLALPGPTDVTGLCVDTGRPLILATHLGILAVDESSLNFRIKADFGISYKMPGYMVGSRPVGMVCTTDGRILVATRSTGVMEFVRKTDGYDFRQLVFY
jgi:hypothetical protein